MLNKIHIESYTTKTIFKYWFDITKLTIMIWPIIYKKRWPPWFQNTKKDANLGPKIYKKGWQPALDSTSRSYIWCYKVQLQIIKITLSPESFVPILPRFPEGAPRLRIQTIAPYPTPQDAINPKPLQKQLLIFNPKPYLQNHRSQIFEWTPRPTS